MKEIWKTIIKKTADDDFDDLNHMLPIGKLSKLTGVSIRSIRHYCDMGIVVPDFVDVKSGYRYFTPDKITRLLLIKELRDFGFSLPDITEMVSGKKTEESIASFNERIRDIQGTIDELEKSKKKLELLTDKYLWVLEQDQSNHKIQIEESHKPKRQLIVLKKNNAYMDGLSFKDAFEKLEIIIEENNLESEGVYGALFHEIVTDYTLTLTMHYCVFFNNINNALYDGINKQLASLTENFETEQYELVNLLEGQYIHVVYKGDYPLVYQYVYPAIEAYLKEHQLKQIGPFIEIYHITRPFDLFSHEPMTEIQVQVTSDDEIMI